jgi:protein phosphatase
MTLVLRYAVRSDVGLLREGNEDSAYAGPRLLAVADGMGGHAAGEVASSLTISAMAKLDSEPPGGDMLAELSSAVAAANTRLQEMIISNPAVEGMGTTLTALFWSDGHAAVCHIGDSRGYLLREGELYQITHDHTLVQSLVDEGRISVDDVSSHPQRSLLLRALDGRSIAEPDLSVHDSQVGDRYLLCSDGLSGVVSDEMLRETMATIDEPEAVTRQLIDLALRGGGPDNITCIVADVVDASSSRLPPTGTPIMAGAAANADDSQPGTDGTAPGAPGSNGGAFDDLDEHLDGHFTGVYDQHGRPHMTAPQPMLTVDDLDPLDPALALAIASENGTDPTAVRARGGHRGQPKRGRRTSRRRWPIVTTSLVVLLAIVAAGGYVAWRLSQDQYYVGADGSGHVVIYRGVNERIAGISLSHPYQTPMPTIELSQVPSPYQQTLQSTDPADSLPSAKAIVSNVQQAVNSCREKYTALQDWATQENKYRADLAAFNKNTKKSPKDKPPTEPKRPTAQPSPSCPPSTAFGIPSSALQPAAAGSS